MASFRGERFFLSNFYPAQVILWYEGRPTLPTAEHAFVWHKTFDPGEKNLVMLARTPGEVKRLGRTLTIRPDWNDIKVEVMRQVVLWKFLQHDDLADRLLATGTEPLVEENEWGDIFWGTCRGVGQNWLGRVLMETRESIRLSNPRRAV